MNKHTLTKTATSTAGGLTGSRLPAHPPHPYLAAPYGFPVKRCLLILVGGAVILLLAGCGGTPVPPGPDMVPLGDGLKVIGYAVLAAAVVLTLGRLI